jgi:hypothetical protein
MTISRPSTRPKGPPLAPFAWASTALLIAGIATAAALGGVFPSPFGEAAEIERYFALESDAVNAGAVFGFASAVPLAIYAAAAPARLRALGAPTPATAIAHTGGLVAAGMLALSGLIQWVLARPAVRGDMPVVRALHDLAFLTGGVGHVVFLGLLVGGIAWSCLQTGLLPRLMSVAGLGIAAVAGLSVSSLIWPTTAILLPLGRFPGLVWLIVAGVLLTRRHAPTPSAAAIAA